MAEVRYLSIAIRDLTTIGDYIAEDNPERAISFVDELRNACESLSEFPERYPINQKLGKDRRQMIYQEYRVFYRYNKQSKKVSIIRVLERHRKY